LGKCQGVGGLYSPVLGDDRRRSAAGAMPGNSRRTTGEQAFSESSDRNKIRRRGWRDPFGGHASVPKSVLYSVRQHGGSRRDRWYSRHDFAAPFAIHRKERQASARRKVRLGLSGRRFDRCCRRYHPFALEGGSDLRNVVRGLGCQPAARDQNCDWREQLRRKLFRTCSPRWVGGRDFWSQGLVWHLPGTLHYGLGTPQGPARRYLAAENCGGALHPYVGHPDR